MIIKIFKLSVKHILYILDKAHNIYYTNKYVDSVN